MTPLDLVPLAELGLLGGIFYRLGGYGTRLDSLEAWRDRVRDRLAEAA